MDPSTLRSRLEEIANELGFDAFGVAPAESSSRLNDLLTYIAEGRHADMEWLARDPQRRADPRIVLPGTRSVVVLAISYFTGDPPPELWNDPFRGRVARYAWGRDYHNVLGKLLRKFGLAFSREAPDANWRAFTDAGPIMEHDIALRAGLGFTGKHTLVIHPYKGSYLHLGVLLSTAEIEPDPPTMFEGGAVWKRDGAIRSCGSCNKCQLACPTQAFPRPYTIDARRCISYHTIENRGSIPVELRHAFRNWVFGCDECQTICPWARKFSTTGNIRYIEPTPDRMAPFLPDLLSLDDASFLKRFAGTPLMRAKRRGMQRNALVALGNSRRLEAIPLLQPFADGPDPLLAEHATWAIHHLRHTAESSSLPLLPAPGTLPLKNFR